MNVAGLNARRRHGFTMLETVVAATLLAVLGTVVAGALTWHRRHAAETRRQAVALVVVGNHLQRLASAPPLGSAEIPLPADAVSDFDRPMLTQTTTATDTPLRRVRVSLTWVGLGRLPVRPVALETFLAPAGDGR